MERIETLLDRSAEPDLLTPALRELYGGGFGFPEPPNDRPWTVINFVTSMEGLTSFAIPGQAGGGHISGFNEGDKFIMGLLRSAADAVAVGANTLRTESEHLWTADYIAAPYISAYQEWRSVRQKKHNHPYNMFVTRSGEVLTPKTERVDQLPAAFSTPNITPLIITTKHGQRRVVDQFQPFGQPKVVSFGNDEVNLAAMMRYLRQELGVRFLLIEGGGQFNGSLANAQLYDEIFLTTAPQIIGSTKANPRPLFVEGFLRTVETAIWHQLVSVKVTGDYLYKRYRRK